MKVALGPFRLLFKVYFGLVFYISLILLFPAFWITTRKKKWYPYCFKLKRLWSRILQLGMFVVLKRSYKSKLPQGNYIIASNHGSYLDIVLMYRLFDKPFIFLGKKELLKWPLFNVFFKTMDIAVDRSNRIKAAKSLIKARNYLKTDYSIAIFPEGTIPDTAPIMKRFKDGAFKLAIEQQVPIIPVSYINNWRLLSDPSNLFGPASPGLSRIVIHDPVETAGMTLEDLVTLRKQVFSVIEAPIRTYNKQSYESQ